MPARVYLKPPELARKSAIHTAYVGDGATGTPEKPAILLSVEFTNGVAREVEESLFQRLADAGIASLERPRLREDD